MNFFKIVTIRGQLVIITIMLLLGFVVIGLTYHRSTDIKVETINQAKFLNRFQLLTKEAHIALTKAQRLEAKFKLNKNIKLINQHQAKVERIVNIIRLLETEAPSTHALTLLKSLENALEQYHIAFKKLVVASKEIGFTNRTGLLGELNRSAFNVEKLIAAIGSPNLTIALLDIRRKEKNYILQPSNLHLGYLNNSIKRFNTLVSNIKIAPQIKSRIKYDMKKYEGAIKEMLFAFEDEKQDNKVLGVKTLHMEKQFETVLKHVNEYVANKNIVFTQRSEFTNLVFLSVLIGITVLMSFVFIRLTRKIGYPLKKLKFTIDSISNGNYDARTELNGADELSSLGRSFDGLIEDRVNNLVRVERENEQLNNSVVSLLEAVSTLSDRDLTIRAPVAEDITGAVGDAINLLAHETADVLTKIQSAAEQVDQTASAVQVQSLNVSKIADNERKVLEHTVMRLQESAKNMNEIADRSKDCDRIAAKAADSTDHALHAVNNAVDGMVEIREVISETEKRIKRLGERSQEINSIVEIINVVAERTHVLALNASMQAAASGEAGRGFAVVADEVQRLAENSRAATLQISELVNSIQSDTAETMNTMNQAISQVVAGSKLTEQAGKQMADTQAITSELIAAVIEISKRSIQQAKISDDIRDRATLVQKSTEQTSLALNNQSTDTNNLVTYASNMLASVHQFKLPGH